MIDDLIRTRRTHKAFGPDPVPDAVLLELFELARWAPNHHLTDPWRFRVLGPRRPRGAQAGRRGRQAGQRIEARPRAHADRRLSAKQTGDAAQDHEDVLATAVASYIVLLGAHARGLAGYWRTVPVMESPAGRAALGIPADELPIGLLHLGDPRQEQRVPDRAPVEEIAFFLRMSG